LNNADWVSVKIDTVDEKIWHKVNRPNGRLEFEKIIFGIRQFAGSFGNKLVTETMLVNGINDNADSLEGTAGFIKEINPDTAYILVPTRPPAEKYVNPPSEENLNTAYQIFNSSINNVQLLSYNEGTDFSYSSDAEKELLSILAVHPMRKDAVESFLSKADTGWNLVPELINKRVLKEVQYSGNIFLVKILD